MIATKKAIPDLNYLAIKIKENVHYQLSIAELVEQALANGEGVLSEQGALAADTGRFTGRSPKDRYIVKDVLTAESVWWGEVNQPMDESVFDVLFNKIGNYFDGKPIFVRDLAAGASADRRIGLRVITETAYQNIFADNLFIRTGPAASGDKPDWSILAAPGYVCETHQDFGLNSPNFVAINMSKKVILIAGTGYTGEIKKGIFSVLNFLLPLQQNVLAMHCSANKGVAGDTALFFGLSGTGKTTLSADKDRCLVGDDEHGWDEQGVFNFEGGCYAKCVGLDNTKEPEIFDAVRFGALLENINFIPGTRLPDYHDVSKTENTRVAYPIHHIKGSVESGVAPSPKHIFFLTADAFGVLPPVSLLSTTQAMYHFVSGYTAKVAGTEVGISEPKAVFSACFGEAFMPLHPGRYAELLGQRLANDGINVWLVNTGWIAGPYGVGRRIKLDYTRAIIRAALNGLLKESSYKTHPVFGLRYPTACPDVPDSVLDPTKLWADEEAYFGQANQLAKLFIANFKKYEDGTNEEVRAASPTLQANVSVA